MRQTGTENEPTNLPEITPLSPLNDRLQCAAAIKLRTAYESALQISEKYRFPPVVNGYPSIQISSQTRRELGNARHRAANELYAHTVVCLQCLSERGLTHRSGSNE
jgi:hypothetical protein